MINRVVLVGRLTRDPEMNVSQSNIAVTKFNLAVNRPFTSKDGEQSADFINIVCFRKVAENVNQYVKKGSLVGIDGRIQTRNYENKDGQRVYVTEVVADSVQFLEPKGTNNESSNNNNSYQEAYGSQSNQATGSKPSYKDNPMSNSQQLSDIPDDDLPF